MSTDTGWDVLRAELTDTMRGQHSAREPRHCIYCGKLTKSVYRVCLDHTDLIELDPGAPSALEDTRAAQPLDADGLPQSLASTPALVSSSAAAQPCATGRTNGDGPAGAAAALDNSETT